MAIAVDRSRPGVTDDQRSKPLAVLGSAAQTDRASPVLNHQRGVTEVKSEEKALDHVGVFGRRKAVARPRGGEPEPWVV